MIKIDRKDLKRKAREAMKLTSPSFWIVTLVFILMTTGVDILVTLASSLTTSDDTLSFFGFFCFILFFLYSAVVQFGYRLWALWSYRRLNPGLGSLLQGFSIAGRIILMEILIFLRIFLWMMLLALAMTILAVMFPSPLVFLLCFAAAYAAVFILMLRYAMTPYLLADRPDEGPGMAIARSVEMMRGRKLELFMLQLSFLGWYLIGFLLSGAVEAFFLVQSGVLNTPLGPDSIFMYQAVLNSLSVTLLSSLVTLPLTLWLTPYTSVAEAGFYDTLSRVGKTSSYDPMPPL